MKHTSLHIIYYGSCTRHLKKCPRCARRGINNGCHFGAFLWRRYSIMRYIESYRHKSSYPSDLYRINLRG